MSDICTDTRRTWGSEPDSSLWMEGPRLKEVSESCSVMSDSLQPHHWKKWSSWHLVPNKWGKSGNSDRFFLDSKNTSHNDCCHEIKRHLLLERKAMTNLNSILKSRDITLPTEVQIVKAGVFPVVMYTCESGPIKKAEGQRTDTFELRCWRRLLRVLWTARRSNQLILKEINPEYSLEGLMLKLKLQYFSHLMWRANWLKKPEAGKDWRQKKRAAEKKIALPIQWTWI